MLSTSKLPRSLVALGLVLTAGMASSGTASGRMRAAAAPVLRQPVAIFGEDERSPVPAKYKAVQEKIGLLFNRRSHVVCTAFCVADNVVATAAHCMHRTHGERPPQLDGFWFARNYDVERHFARIAGYGNGSVGQHIMSGTMDLSVRPPIDASSDWALVRLARPACSKGILPVRELSADAIVAEAAAKHVFQISYHRDFSPWKLAYSRPCDVERSFGVADWPSIARDFSDPARLVLHTCDTGGASSGSPLLLESADGLHVVGINVGTYVQSKVLMQDGQVTERLKADKVANTAVNVGAFADKIEVFRRAAILASPAQLRQLQAALKQRDLYMGPIDGTYSAALRSAIESYEVADGLPRTGLATQALLKRLGGQQSERRVTLPRRS